MINNKFKKPMFNITQDISLQMKFYLDEIKFIEEEIKYWSIENDLQPSENKNIIIEKLQEELAMVKCNYSKLLDDNKNIIRPIYNIKNS